jgi:hypothetical protein
MKRFSQFKLKKLILLFVAAVVIILLYYAFPSYYYYDGLHVQAQLPQIQQSPQQQKPLPTIGIKIISPSTGQQVPIGPLTISGTSTDNATTDCTVYADWNNTKPFQKAIATGSGGVNDYSTWKYTYTNNYHLITNGTNDLTSKLSCISSPTNLTKFYSVNVIGISTMTNNKTGATSAEEVQQQESPTIDNTTTNVTLDNGTTTVVEEERLRVKDNISSPTSIPIPLVANDFAFDRVNVNITSPKSGQEVPVGNLTIAGHSSDNLANDCIVYTNWNGQNPLQIAKALGPAGANDYSTWSFTYTPAYHAITNGTNELTAQISCLDDDSNNNNNTTATYLTNYYRVNVTGVTETSSSSAERTTSSEAEKEQTNGGSGSIPIPLPSPLPSSPPSTQKQEEEDKDVEKEEPEPEPEPQPEAEPEPEPEPEPQPTTPLTEEDDDITEDTDEQGGNTVKQEKKVKEVQEEDNAQKQLQQMLEKAGKINEDVQQKVEKAKEDILEEIKKGFK